MKQKYQLISWFPSWRGIGFINYGVSLHLVYEWAFNLGFWEIRKWKI